VKSDVMSAAGLAIYAELGLVLFLAVFVAVVVRLLWPGRTAEFERLARIPLDDELPQPSGARTSSPPARLSPSPQQGEATP